MEGRDVVIVEAIRTPVARGHAEKGYYREVHPNELRGRTWAEAIARAGIESEIVEDVIASCVQPYGEQSYNIGRNAWLRAGLPVETPATTIDRQCGSAQQAVNFAAALIASGVHDVVLGGGVEHIGHVPLSANGKIAEELRTRSCRTQGVGARIPLAEDPLEHLTARRARELVHELDRPR